MQEYFRQHLGVDSMHHVSWNYVRLWLSVPGSAAEPDAVNTSRTGNIRESLQTTTTRSGFLGLKTSRSATWVYDVGGVTGLYYHGKPDEFDRHLLSMANYAVATSGPRVTTCVKRNYDGTATVQVRGFMHRDDEDAGAFPDMYVTTTRGTRLRYVDLRFTVLVKAFPALGLQG